MTDEMKDLPPEERIKRLKKLEKDKKKEIAEAEKLIRESEDEITQREKWQEKVPIPELAQESLDGLSGEAKQVLKERKGLQETPKVDLEPEPIMPPQSDEPSLEETIARTPIDIHPGVFDSEYAINLSQRPMQDLYGEISGIHQRVENKGYVSKEEENRIQYLASAVEHKVKDAEAGKYSFTADAAHAASLSQQLGAKVHNVYSSSQHTSGVHGHDWYKG